MTPSDLDLIEARLKISLPAQYRKQMQTRSKELAGLENLPVYTAPKRLIDENLAERKKKSPTASAYPEWWNEFLIIGDNGAGEYYALRLDADNKVWMIGDEHGHSAAKRYQSLKQFIDTIVGERLKPSPKPSSFNDSLPLIERFSFVVWEDQCTVDTQTGDFPLTAERLASHGIKLTAITRAVRKLLAALYGCKSSAIRFADPPYEVEDEGLRGEMRILYERPPMRDPRLRAAAVRIFRGIVKLELELANSEDDMPPVSKTPLDWSAVQVGIRGLLETFHPAGTTVSFTKPKKDGWWQYMMRYTLR